MKKKILCIMAFLAIGFFGMVLSYSEAYANQSKYEYFGGGYTLTGNPVKDMVSIANAQEGRSQEQFGYTEGWCDNFVSDCAIIAGCAAEIPQGGDVADFLKNLLNAGATQVYTPQAGDVVIYNNNDHAALMVDDLYSVHGNIWNKGYSHVVKCKYTDFIPLYSCAFYRPNYKMNISFDVNGDGATVNKTSMTVKLGQTIGTMPTPKRSGYTWLGWYTSKTGGNKVTMSTPANTLETTKLYAHWAKNIKLTFDANGGKVSKTSMIAAKGQQVGVMPTPTRSGYTWAGWYTAKSSGTRITMSTTANFSKNITLYAHWIKNIKISFNANFGTVSKTSMIVLQGQTIGVMPTPKRSGYFFAGWYTSLFGNNRITMSTPANFKGDITLYAHWTKTSYFTDDLVWFHSYYNVTHKTVNIDLTGDGKADKVEVYCYYKDYNMTEMYIYVNGYCCLSKKTDKWTNYIKIDYIHMSNDREFLLVQEESDGYLLVAYICQYKAGSLVTVNNLNASGEGGFGAYTHYKIISASPNEIGVNISDQNGTVAGQAANYTFKYDGKKFITTGITSTKITYSQSPFTCAKTLKFTKEIGKNTIAFTASKGSKVTLTKIYYRGDKLYGYFKQGAFKGGWLVLTKQVRDNAIFSNVRFAG